MCHSEILMPPALLCIAHHMCYQERMKHAAVSFHALLQGMLEKDVVAYCRFTRTAGSGPRMCYLLPQPEIIDSEHGIQVRHLCCYGIIS